MSRPKVLSRAASLARFDDAVDTWWQQHARGRKLLDLILYGASAAGEHSALWLVLSAAAGWRPGTSNSAKSATAAAGATPAPLLGASRSTGRPAGVTRALVRGLLLFSTESLLVNGLLKSVFRRERPVSQEPRPLPLRIPRTTSFPSGHASSAFFAAALLRDDLGSSACYPLAMLVAISRVHVRIHHASDVVAGAALGAALGEVARRVFPVVDRRPAR